MLRYVVLALLCMGLASSAFAFIGLKRGGMASGTGPPPSSPTMYLVNPASTAYHVDPSSTLYLVAPP